MRFTLSAGIVGIGDLRASLPCIVFGKEAVHIIVRAVDGLALGVNHLGEVAGVVICVGPCAVGCVCWSVQVLGCEAATQAVIGEVADIAQCVRNVGQSTEA